MNVEKYKSDYLDKRMQLILFYKDSGKIIYSTETLFIVLSHDIAYKINLFMESISSVLENLTYGNPLTFSCINSETDGKDVFYDYQFEIPSEQESDLVVMQVFNFSDHYENLTHMQQERNELEIHKEILKLEQEKVFAQNELLEFKNNELERLQKLKTDFFARVSHEIRNPVNGISGLIQLISQNYQDQQKIEEYLEALSSTSDHLVNMVNNVLDFSKLESTDNNLELEKIEFDCREMVRSVLNSFLFNANEKRISLGSKISDNIPKWLIGDKYKLTQVITNLIGNAVKFTHEGGIMLIVSEEDNQNEISNIRFELRDTGIGIPDSMLKDVFNPYIQADQSVKRLYGGTGLGLPIVKNLVELMNGSVSVSSIEGEGSIFTFTIPLETITKETLIIENESISLFFNGRVLIGEDDLINQKVMEGIFEKEKVTCDIASDGEEALNLFGQNTYDLVILDVNMPVIDGMEVADTIRKKSDVPIIINSGRPYSEFKSQLSSLKNIEYLQKPISQLSFIKTINTITGSLTKVVDFALLQNLFGDNPKRVNEIIAIFREEAPENIQNMKQYFRNNEFERLKGLVHKAKSSFAYFGMKSTYNICDQIEKDLEKRVKKNYLLEIKKIEKDTILAINELTQ